MKFILKLLLTLLIANNSNLLFAQIQKNSNEITLLKEVDISEFKGKNYQYKVDIKYEHADSQTQIGIHAIQIGSEKFELINATGLRNVETPKTNNIEWKTLTIEGQLTANSHRIWLYIIASGNGDIFFDNIRLSIQNDKNEWQDISIENSDFEKNKDIKKVLKSFKNTTPLLKNKNITASIAETNSNKCLYFNLKNNVIHFETYYGYNPSKGNYVTLNDGKKIYYETYGDGEPMILLHGNGGSINSFKKQIPEFSKYYKVIAIDTRGQGNSTDNHSPSFNYETFAQDLETLINQLKFEKVNIVGWSDGAITGILYAMKHPEKVNKMVLMGANLNPSEEAVSTKIIKTVQKDIARLKKENNPNDLTTIKLLEMVLREPNINPQELSKIKAKTLVMAGENDLVLEKHTKLIANEIPGATLKIVANETHFLPEEHPELFNTIVLDFLK